MSKLTCVIIDDEPLARECIANYVKEVEFLKLAGEGNNPLDLIQLIETHAPDLIFLDIQMPVMNGIDFLKANSRVPMVVITTAYPSYALESFQLDVMDYLVKPIVFNRFFQAVCKARDYHQLIHRAGHASGTPAADYIFLKCGHKFERINLDEILYIEALQNYVTVYTTRGKFITQLPLKNVEQNLTGKPFMRVHKSFIVSIGKIEAIENNEIILAKNRIPISRHYRDAVMEQVVNAKLWKK
jgi:two-component system LytT family response regulator